MARRSRPATDRCSSSGRPRCQATARCSTSPSGLGMPVREQLVGERDKQDGQRTRTRGKRQRLECVELSLDLLHPPERRERPELV